MSALLDAYTSGLRGASGSERKIRANILAQSLLTEVLNSPIRVASINSGNYEKLKWSVRTSLLDRIQTGKGKTLKELGLYRVVITVGVKSGNLTELETVKVGSVNE